MGWILLLKWSGDGLVQAWGFAGEGRSVVEIEEGGGGTKRKQKKATVKEDGEGWRGKEGGRKWFSCEMLRVHPCFSVVTQL